VPTESSPGELVGDGLLKHDFRTGRTDVRRFPADAVVGEAVFVPSAVDAAEDDGYLMVLAYDADRAATDLVILSAQDFTGPPVAVVHLPVRVPPGFHGNWLPDR
jgi:carotenoid cleavage dioxygenase